MCVFFDYVAMLFIAFILQIFPRPDRIEIGFVRVISAGYKTAAENLCVSRWQYDAVFPLGFMEDVCICCGTDTDI